MNSIVIKTSSVFYCASVMVTVVAATVVVAVVVVVVVVVITFVVAFALRFCSRATPAEHTYELLQSNPVQTTQIFENI